MLYLLYKIALSLLRILKEKAAYAAVSFCAKVKYAVSKRDREIVKTNLRHVFPEADAREISSLAKNVFLNFGKYLVDFFSLIKNREDYLKDAVALAGLENLDNALESGKGCILLSGHTGNWELMGCAIARLGYKLNVVALEHADPRIDDIFTRLRRNTGIRVMRAGGASKACKQTLRKGEILAIMGDRPFADRGIEVKFFGRAALFPRSAGLFSLKYGAPIVMLFSHQENEKHKKCTAVFEKPLLIKRNGDIESRLKEITQSFADRFEDHIKKYPSQWYMFNKVWKE